MLGYEHLPPDREAVRAVAFSRIAGEPDVTTNVSFHAPPFTATVDVRRPQKPEGMAGVTVREGTGVKRAYLVEAAFISYCAQMAGEPLSRLYVMYVNKTYVRGETLDSDALFVTADVTRRAARLLEEHRGRLDGLKDEIEADPTLERYRGILCKRPHACPVCSEDVEPVAADHVLTLHRGMELARELIEEGYETIPEVPRDRLTHPRQRIQQSVIVEQRPHVDEEALRAFLGTLDYPLHYLDFEAVSSAVPRYSGTRPWEHVPYLFSLHTESGPGAPAEHSWFFMRPGEDERDQLAARLVSTVGESGSVVVYSAAFEQMILKRLADWVPAQADGLRGVSARVVDLLTPFRDFSFYHHGQRGKVSLKSVFPVLAGVDYSHLEVQDGYTANISYRYLCDHPDERQKLVEQLVEYCRMDTLAMVRIIAELRLLAG